MFDVAIHNSAGTQSPHVTDFLQTVRHRLEMLKELAEAKSSKLSKTDNGNRTEEPMEVVVQLTAESSVSHSQGRTSVGASCEDIELKVVADGESIPGDANHVLPTGDSNGEEDDENKKAVRLCKTGRYLILILLLCLFMIYMYSSPSVNSYSGYD